jgi:hypothetical protein
LVALDLSTPTSRRRARLPELQNLGAENHPVTFAQPLSTLFLGHLQQADANHRLKRFNFIWMNHALNRKLVEVWQACPMHAAARPILFAKTFICLQIQMKSN